MPVRITLAGYWNTWIRKLGIVATIKHIKIVELQEPNIKIANANVDVATLLLAS